MHRTLRVCFVVCFVLFCLFVRVGCACLRLRPSSSPSSAFVACDPDVYTYSYMSHQPGSDSGQLQVRQIQNISPSASPPQPATAASNVGQLASGINPGSPPLMPQATIIVDVVTSLLSSRADAASILATVVARLEPSTGQSNHRAIQPDVCTCSVFN